MLHRILLITLIISTVFALILIYQTNAAFRPFPDTLAPTEGEIRKLQILDRHHQPLTITYQNQWNLHDNRPLHEIPETLQQIFILSEDKRFYEHKGPDWLARWHAIWQNLKSFSIVRGASTITEQVVRMLHPRRRTFWSRWVEGFEAAQLEQKFSKADILEFYLNQVPYASQRRGVVQAARHYFDRELDTLNLKEMMALSVLVRSPSRLDLKQGTTEIHRPLKDLADRLLALKLITPKDYQQVLNEKLQLHQAALPVEARHFVNYVYQTQMQQVRPKQTRLTTTLDGHLQRKVQHILKQRLIDLENQKVNHGAILVVNHQTNEVLAWVNEQAPNQPPSHIDAITTPRQPGSTLKPFLYALALEKGWTAATLIHDAPLAEPVGTGLHSYRNYSHHYYGMLRLRDALSNSLNIPAIRTIQFVGAHPFLTRLHQLGMKSLDAHSNFYGDGLALGNGEVTLFELVQAYTTLANRGQFKPLKTVQSAVTPSAKPIFSPLITSLIANILSDADARRLEFGRDHLLDLPVQTAVKTGTSTDYRDAWSVGFNYHYTVGVWLGNLDQQAMSQVSGASGASLVLRAVFAELNRHKTTQPLFLHPQLQPVTICRDTGLPPAQQPCATQTEWFLPGTAPKPTMTLAENLTHLNPPALQQPTPGLQLALDPRIPDDYEAFRLQLAATDLNEESRIEWLINDEVIGITSGEQLYFLWSPVRGTHIAQARIWQDTQDTETPISTAKIKFYVK